MKSLRLHPFACRIVASCHQLNEQGLAPGSQTCMTAFDEIEQLLWTTPEGQSFSQLAAEQLSLQSFERLDADDPETTTFKLAPASPLMPQRFWERDADILRLQNTANVLLQSYAPHVVAWVHGVHTNHFQSLPDGFHALLLPTTETSILLPALKAQTDAAKPVNLIMAAHEAPIILASSPEEAVAQLIWLEAFARTQLLVSRLHSS